MIVASAVDVKVAKEAVAVDATAATEVFPVEITVFSDVPNEAV